MHDMIFLFNTWYSIFNISKIYIYIYLLYLIFITSLFCRCYEDINATFIINTLSKDITEFHLQDISSKCPYILDIIQLDIYQWVRHLLGILFRSCIIYMIPHSQYIYTYASYPLLKIIIFHRYYSILWSPSWSARSNYTFKFSNTYLKIVVLSNKWLSHISHMYNTFVLLAIDINHKIFLFFLNLTHFEAFYTYSIYTI